MDSNIPAEAAVKLETKPKMYFSGTVVKIALAGAVVDIGTGEPAAIHVSQIVPPGNEPIKRVEDVLQIGQKIDVWVRRIKEGRIELTMLKPLDLEWREIKVGMTVKGKVVRLEKFGAFVEIGAERPGLIHISEMSHDYVRTPTDVVKEGDEVEAMVLEINRKKKQIKLSMKALQTVPEEEEKEEKPAEAPKIEEPKEKTVRRKKNQRRSESSSDTEENLLAIKEPEESESDTALGIALREAMQRAKTTRKQQSDKTKKAKSLSQDQDDLLSRTLETRLPSS